MLRRISALVLASILLFAMPALAEDVPLTWLDGYCDEDGKPVLNRPPLPTEFPSCDDSGLTIRYAEQDLTGDIDKALPYQALELPEPDLPGFAYWVRIDLNNTWLISAKVTKDRKEPKALLLKDTGRVIMPIRFFTEAIGGEVEYSKDGTVLLRWQGKEIILRIGETVASVDGQRVTLDQPPLIVWGRTLVPTRFVMESFGADIKWEAKAGLVKVAMPNATCSNMELCFRHEGW